MNIETHSATSSHKSVAGADRKKAGMAEAVGGDATSGFALLMGMLAASDGATSSTVESALGDTLACPAAVSEGGLSAVGNLPVLQNNSYQNMPTAQVGYALPASNLKALVGLDDAPPQPATGQFASRSGLTLNANGTLQRGNGLTALLGHLQQSDNNGLLDQAESALTDINLPFSPSQQAESLTRGSRLPIRSSDLVPATTLVAGAQMQPVATPATNAALVSGASLVAGAQRQPMAAAALSASLMPGASLVAGAQMQPVAAPATNAVLVSGASLVAGAQTQPLAAAATNAVLVPSASLVASAQMQPVAEPATNAVPLPQASLATGEKGPLASILVGAAHSGSLATSDARNGKAGAWSDTALGAAASPGTAQPKLSTDISSGGHGPTLRPAPAELKEVKVMPATVDLATRVEANSTLVLAGSSADGVLRTQERLATRSSVSRSGDANDGAFGLASGVNARADAPYQIEAAAAAVPDSAIAETVSYWVTQGVQNAELTLDGFGSDPVEVSISLNGDQAHIDFRTNQADVRQALEAATADLRDSLSGQGLQLAGVSVGTSGSRNEQGNAQPSSPGTRQVEAQAEPTPAPAQRRSINASVGQSLDLFV